MATKKKAAKSAKPAKALSPEETVRAIPRTCKGPRTDTWLQPVGEKHRRLVPAAQVGDEITRLLADGQLREASAADAESRVACGYDVNALILKGGLDGKEHSSACPKCKQPLSWRAPTFD